MNILYKLEISCEREKLRNFKIHVTYLVLMFMFGQKLFTFFSSGCALAGEFHDCAELVYACPNHVFNNPLQISQSISQTSYPSFLISIMDLNICIEIDGIRDSDSIIRSKLERCRQLGFRTIALSVCIDITHFAEKSKQQIVVPPPPNDEIIILAGLKVYTRLTVKVSETIQLFKLHKNSEASKYALLALEPQNNKIFQYICTSSTDLDILTFNLSERLDYNLFKTKFGLLQTRGVCFEINYGPAQLGSTLRRNIICNGQNLVEKINKNLILSSGVQDIFRLRGPKDAESIGVLFMIPFKRCHETVYTNAQRALECAQHRMQPISSAVEMIEG